MDKSKMYFWDVLALFLLVVTLGILFFGLPFIAHWGGSFTPARTITVTAQGKTTATPDEADISFSVIAQGANPATLSNTSNQKMNSVMSFIASEGIVTSDITTVNYNLQPNYQYDKNGNQIGVLDYTLTQTVEVKIRDLTKTAAVLGGLAPLGVDNISNVDFTFQNPDEFIALAREDALSKAKSEAQSMASEANASLGDVLTITESSYVPGPLPVYAMAESTGAMNASTPSISPGTQDVTDEVTATYALN